MALVYNTYESYQKSCTSCLAPHARLHPRVLLVAGLSDGQLNCRLTRIHLVASLRMSERILLFKLTSFFLPKLSGFLHLLHEKNFYQYGEVSGDLQGSCW